jgi:hypothetical protein
MEGRPRLTTALREGEQVSPLELFFDLAPDRHRRARHEDFAHEAAT